MVVSPAAAVTSVDGEIRAILSPSTTMAWLVRNSPVRTLSTPPARITVLFGAGACALAVVVIAISVARTAAMATPDRLISRPDLACDHAFFKTFIQAPRCKLTLGTRRV